ncbi:hypothetical protein IH992_04135 [Candidatus Poribacteria bacterium]|nr:hypothetical protein [Candidatus Poribacteria bacterium]
MTNIEAQNIIDETMGVLNRTQSRIGFAPISMPLRARLQEEVMLIRSRQSATLSQEGFGFPFLIPLVVGGIAITSALGFGISKNLKDATRLDKRVDCILRAIEELGMTESDAERICTSSSLTPILMISALGLGLWFLFK